MAPVTGIGGFFFRPRDPDALNRWYAEHFGVVVVNSRTGCSWRGSTGGGYEQYRREHRAIVPPARDSLTLSADEAFLGRAR